MRARKSGSSSLPGQTAPRASKILRRVISVIRRFSELCIRSYARRFGVRVVMCCAARGSLLLAGARLKLVGACRITAAGPESIP